MTWLAHLHSVHSAHLDNSLLGPSRTQYTVHTSILKPAHMHCTMRTLYSIFSSRPNKMGHDFTLPYCDIIQHIFVPTRSVARKTLLWTFSWASNSKFAIFLQLYPCNNYRAIKYPPVSIECGMEYPPVSQTLLIQGDNLSPCIIYRAFLNTGGSYCTMCTLCSAMSEVPFVLFQTDWQCAEMKVKVFLPLLNGTKWNW